MLLSYNTNGLAHHNLIDAMELLADIGYEGVAITLDHGSLNPYSELVAAQLDGVLRVLAKLRLRCVVETGARYLLDPRTKHEPTLVSADPAGRTRRVEFLCLAIDIAAKLGADCVSIWSGVVHNRAGKQETLARLIEGLARVLDYAQLRKVVVSFEPEPGMLIDTLGSFDNLLTELAKSGVDSSPLKLTIDIGHLHCLGEVPLDDHLRRWADRLVNLHVEDMRQGVHEHLMFGEGEIEFHQVFKTLHEIRYSGLVSVELSRHSHEAPIAARRAYNYLQPLVDAGHQ